MRTDVLRHLAAGTLILLAGCGGGGGGDGGGSAASTVQPAGQPMSISTSNYTTVATEGANNVDHFAGQGTGAVALVGAETGSGRSTAQQALKALRIWQAAGSAPAVLTGAVVTKSVACAVSGSISGTFNDLNGNQLLDASGETVTLTLNNCNEGTGETAGGQFLVGLNAAVSGDPATDVYSINMTFALRNFRIVDATSDLSANGELRIVASSTSAGNSSATLSSTAFGASMTMGGVTRSFALHNVNYSLVEIGGVGALTYSGTLTSSQFNGNSVSFRTTTPLRIASGASFPSSGVVVATGAGNARATLTVLNTSQVNIQYDANGDGVAESSTLRNWIDFL